MSLIGFARFTMRTNTQVPALINLVRAGTRRRSDRRWWYDSPARALRLLWLGPTGFRVAMRIGRTMAELVATGRFTPCPGGTLVSVAIRPPWGLTIFIVFWCSVVLFGTVPGFGHDPGSWVFGLGLVTACAAIYVAVFSFGIPRLREELERVLRGD